LTHRKVKQFSYADSSPAVARPIDQELDARYIRIESAGFLGQAVDLRYLAFRRGDIDPYPLARYFRRHNKRDRIP
jgi:hypothetical protein